MAALTEGCKAATTDDDRNYPNGKMTFIIDDTSSEEFISLFKVRHITEEFYGGTKRNFGLKSYKLRWYEATCEYQ
jgi:hypothetical protein